MTKRDRPARDARDMAVVPKQQRLVVAQHALRNEVVDQVLKRLIEKTEMQEHEGLPNRAKQLAFHGLHLLLMIAAAFLLPRLWSTPLIRIAAALIWPFVVSFVRRRYSNSTAKSMMETARSIRQELDSGKSTMKDKVVFMAKKIWRNIPETDLTVIASIFALFPFVDKFKTAVGNSPTAGNLFAIVSTAWMLILVGIIPSKMLSQKYRLPVTYVIGIIAVFTLFLINPSVLSKSSGIIEKVIAPLCRYIFGSFGLGRI